MAAKKTAKTKIVSEKTKKAAKGQQAKAAEPKKLSAIDAAAKVLGETSQPMNCKELIETMAAKGYWSSPAGRTPHATLYSAILREIGTQGTESRFVKADRGKFALAAAAPAKKANKAKTGAADIAVALHTE